MSSLSEKIRKDNCVYIPQVSRAEDKNMLSDRQIQLILSKTKFSIQIIMLYSTITLFTLITSALAIPTGEVQVSPVLESSLPCDAQRDRSADAHQLGTSHFKERQARRHTEKGCRMQPVDISEQL